MVHSAVVRDQLTAALGSALSSCAGDHLVERDLRQGLPGSSTGPLWILALGKAAVAMTAGAYAALGAAVTRALVICSEGTDTRCLPRSCEVIRGEHPLPGAGSLHAGQRLLAVAAEARDSDASVLVLLSGGASSLAEAPRPGVALEALTGEAARLLAGGAPIEVINAARARLSRLKGGGLAATLGSALRWVRVIVDIPSGDPAVVGSGPCAGAAGVDVRALATPSTLAHAAAAYLERAGVTPVVVGAPIAGCPLPALVAAARGALLRRGGAWVTAGEVAVPMPTALPEGARGGRAQHAALSVFAECREISTPWGFLAAGSDGRDGSGGAGACVGSWLAGLPTPSASAALSTFSSGSWHAAVGTLLPEWEPRTNVTDLYVALAT